MSICVSDVSCLKSCCSFVLHDVSHYCLYDVFHFCIGIKATPMPGRLLIKNANCLNELLCIRSTSCILFLGVCCVNTASQKILAHHPLKLKNFKMP
jgi:hypothetical protein